MSVVPEMFTKTATERVYSYDTTLRDGAQRKGLTFSLSGKLKLTQLLADTGFDYIEGGWPGSNPKDADYFVKVRELDLGQTRIAAFGSTRRVARTVSADAQMQALLAANTKVVTLFGKASSLQVTDVLRTTLDENLQLIADSVAFIKDAGRELIFDAEHFFDGYRQDAGYALACVHAALEAGADQIVLCDTNGGSLPDWIAQLTAQVCAQTGVPVGVHAHNDSELAVANSLAAVQAGARHVQGTINGYGERCGNANLLSVIANLHLKMGRQCRAAQHLAQFTTLSRQVAELANIAPDAFAPYVGVNAFSHKGGVHASALARSRNSYEHIAPELVGNAQTIVVSELAGFSNLLARAQEFGIGIDALDQSLLDLIKTKAAQGLHLEAADGSLELLLRKKGSDYRSPFTLQQLRIISHSSATCATSTDAQNDAQMHSTCQATCKLAVGSEQLLTVAEAAGPVAAADAALRKALLPYWPALSELKLSDYSVRILDPEQATAATTRVLLEASWRGQRWSTVGASANIISASVDALLESFELFIYRYETQKGARAMPSTLSGTTSSETKLITTIQERIELGPTRNVTRLVSL